MPGSRSTALEELQSGTNVTRLRPIQVEHAPQVITVRLGIDPPRGFEPAAIIRRQLDADRARDGGDNVVLESEDVGLGPLVLIGPDLAPA